MRKLGYGILGFMVIIVMVLCGWLLLKKDLPSEEEETTLETEENIPKEETVIKMGTYELIYDSQASEDVKANLPSTFTLSSNGEFTMSANRCSYMQELFGNYSFDENNQTLIFENIQSIDTDGVVTSFDMDTLKFHIENASEVTFASNYGCIATKEEHASFRLQN